MTTPEPSAVEPPLTDERIEAMRATRERLGRGEYAAPSVAEPSAVEPTPATKETIMEQDTAQDYDLAEMAWGIIANAGGGDWTQETSEWQEAAARWRDEYHATLRHV